MRVLLVDHSRALWGAERVLLELGPRLAARGVDVHLACPSGGSFAAAWTAAGLPHLDLGLPDHHGIRDERGGRSPRWLAREAGVVARSVAVLARQARAFDVLHANHQWAHVEVALAARLARRPAVLHLHDLLPAGVGRRLFRGASRISGATLVACQAITDALGPPSPPRVEVLYPALDLAEYRPGPPDPAVRAALGGVPEAPLVGIVGRLDPVKGIDILIQALAMVDGAAGCARLAVVGAALEATDAYVRELRDLAEHHLPGRVTFAGLRSDVPAVLRALDVLVNSSRHEPFGTIVLEGQACGRAVIATTAGGVGEHVEHGVTGLMIPAEDTGALAAALAGLLGDAPRREAMGAAARAMVERVFDVEDAADHLVDVYRRLVDGQSGGR